MPLETGRQLGPYQIEAPLGAGGMGEVYKARDTRLDRTVAIKVLPEHVASDPDLKQRFEREARTVAALNHPHICTLHDIGSQDGIDFLVMEHLEGQTLAQRLEKGALPLDQALRYAIEIADALDKAHRQGVVHRDIKPGNIMLTKAGAKLLDFGLAKLRKAGSAGTDLAETVTQSSPMTQQGTILGTPQYMAPEQVEGKDTDARADMFAFGAVVYEMVTGQRAFNATTQASLIAAILDRDPVPLLTLQPVTPPLLDHLVQRCLTKDPNDRWQSAGDLASELRWITEHPAETGRASEIPSRSWPLVASAAGLAAVVAATLVWFVSGPAAVDQASVQFSVSLPPGDEFGIDAGTPMSLALSPNSDRVVYMARRDGVSRLYSRYLDELDAEPIPGTEGGHGPFFSPDGEWLGFTGADGTIKKLPLAGGSPITLTPATPAAGVLRASWAATGQIIFSSWASPLMAVSEDGGAPELVTHLDESQGETWHGGAHVLPDGNAVLFSVNDRVEMMDLATGERRFVVDGRDPYYASTGHLVFARGDTVLAAPFDLGGAITGQPVRLFEGAISANRTHFAVAPNGTVVYVPTAPETMGTLAWVDREGRWRPATDEQQPFEHPRLSPDGTRVAVTVRREAGREIWVYDTRGGRRVRLADAPAARPIWTPDGASVTFRRGPALYAVLADGSDDPQLLLEQEDYTLHTLAWSQTGVLAYSANGRVTGRNVWMLSPGGTPEECERNLVGN